MVFSDAEGVIHVWDSSDPSELTPFCSFRAHEFEAWCAALDTTNDKLIYSGGDDGCCCILDIRTPNRTVQLIRHEVGVCSVRNLQTLDNHISTGSYDEYVRVWDLRTTSSSQNTRPVLMCHLGGGVWRHKWAINDSFLVSACMHGGFSISGPFPSTLIGNTVAKDGTVMHTIGRYRASAKLGYGVDWIQHPSETCWTVATCSFYDNQVDFSRLSVCDPL
ncbi:diphthine methyl ester acylhydrolase [Paragonimus westermani]|uniref:methylated diphthine methylhydrolase n=1 Tax=Paragonimus westermani TaxID=34504 RepID=A0A5J4NMW9_9TREM|nr:diphthine methyl ester acylhydrolase [Paragonimus westermani]